MRKLKTKPLAPIITVVCDVEYNTDQNSRIKNNIANTINDMNFVAVISDAINWSHSGHLQMLFTP